ncbi:PilZ domain-containing protein [Sphingomonas sp. 3-13AW]|uniref:PilZ domain-containing protein n=1 Tax=Sphingomonas sp. 3-13AW TaxID=3050450 RepID=UPI003BB761C7
MNNHLPENRSEPRRSILFAITVEIGGRRIPGRVRDHSVLGCRLKLSEPLRKSDIAVQLLRGEHAMAGDIVWQQGTSVGIRFSAPPPEGMFTKQ